MAPKPKESFGPWLGDREADSKWSPISWGRYITRERHFFEADILLGDISWGDTFVVGDIFFVGDILLG